MGSVVISVDAELAWGFLDFHELPHDRLRRAREMWRRLVDLLEEYQIPATWAIVGHLFLSECDGRHADHPRDLSWFEHDPGTDHQTDDLWYAPDLVEYLTASAVDHDVGGHSFSHVNFETAGAGVAQREAQLWCDVASDWGFSPTSFVFPRNDVGNLQALAETEFTCYRGPNPLLSTMKRLSPVVKAFGGVGLGPQPPLVEPRVDEHGLVDIPASLFLFSFEGFPNRAISAVSRDPVVQMARQGIDRATQSDGIFHMWLHPNNIRHESDIERLASIFSHLDRRQTETQLTVETMADVSNRIVQSPDVTTQSGLVREDRTGN